MSEAAVETTEEVTTEKTQPDESVLSEETNEESTDEKPKTVLGEDEEEDEASDTETKEAEPEAYDFADVTLPEGMELTEEWSEALGDDPVFKKIGKEGAEHLLSLMERWEAEKTNVAVESINSRIREWGQGIENHPDVVARGEGGYMKTVREAKAARDVLFGSDSDLDVELRMELRTSGLGSHPSLVLAMAKVARELGLVEDVTEPMDGKSPTEATKSKNLFPKSAPRAD